MIICFDGDYPELSRITAVRGAEVIVRPSALLRSADIWELTNRARAYDNHVYVVGANATGTDPGGRALLRQLDDRHPGRRGGRPGREPRVLGQRPARPGHRDVLAHARVERPAGLRPPGRPQPRPDTPVRRRPGPAGGDLVPARGARTASRSTDVDLPGARLNAAIDGAIRIGIDTGGTFTDVVALDEEHRRAGHHQDAVDAGRTRPTGSWPGSRKVLGLLGATGGDVAAGQPRHHGRHQPAARGQGRRRSGFITTEGYEFVLEIARQCVPDGYGNSYFWVKPPRIVPADRVRDRRRPAGLPGRRDPAVRRGPGGRGGPVVPRRRASTRIGVCFLHSYADPAHELRDARRAAPRAPRRRRLDLQRRAAGVPRVRAVGDHAGRRRGEAEDGVATSPTSPPGCTRSRPDVPFYVMKSNGGVLSADEVVHQPITTVLSGPAAGALGAALVARERRLRPGAHLRRRRHLDRRVGRARRRADADHRGHRRPVPQQDPDDRRRHGRRRRRLGRLDLAGGHAEGRPALGRRRPRAALLRPRRHRADGHRRARRARPDPAAPAGRRDPARRRGRPRRAAGASPTGSGSASSECATGILEISAWNQANALRQVTVKRGLDVRDFTMATFGGSGSLLLCRLVDILGLAGVLVPREPGQPVGVRAAHRRRAQRLRADGGEPARRPRPRPGGRACYDELQAQAAEALDREGFARAEHRLPAHRRPALRRAGVRGAGRRRRTGRSTTRSPPRSPTRSTHAHEQLYGYAFRRRPAAAGRVGEPAGHRRRPDRAARAARAAAAGGRRRSARAPAYGRCSSTTGSTPRSTGGPTSRRTTSVTGPAVIEEFGSTVPLHPGFAARVDRFGNLLVTREADR